MLQNTKYRLQCSLVWQSIRLESFVRTKSLSILFLIQGRLLKGIKNLIYIDKLVNIKCQQTPVIMGTYLGRILCPTDTN